MAREFIEPYAGLTFPPEFGDKKRLAKWKKEYCPLNIHLFDEVHGGSEHYLHCEACGLMVHIAGIETSDAACERVRDNERPPQFVVIERASLSEPIEKYRFGRPKKEAKS